MTHSDTIEVPECEICGGRDFREVGKTDRDGAALSTCLCMGCGMVFSNPRPSPAAIERYYREDYRVQYKDAVQPKPKHTLRAGQVALERMTYLRPHLTQGCRILDMGCGGGELLFMLRSLGYEVSGIEPNEGYGLHARSALGLAVQIGNYQTANVALRSQDVVVAFHVVEHLEHPVEALHTMASWLKEGGRMLIEVPNILSPSQWPSSRYHYAHLYNFTPSTLAMAGQRAGLKVISAATSADEGNVICVFQRGDATQLPDGSISGHGMEVASFLRGHSALRHAFTAHPYIRPVRRFLRSRREKSALRNAGEATEILSRLLSSAVLEPKLIPATLRQKNGD